MRKYRVTFEGRLTSSEGQLDRSVLDALKLSMSELDGIDSSNAWIDIDLAVGAIAISCCVTAAGTTRAVQSASDIIRLALSEGSIGTPEWPKPDDERWHVEFVRTRSDLLVAAA